MRAAGAEMPPRKQPSQTRDGNLLRASHEVLMCAPHHSPKHTEDVCRQLTKCSCIDRVLSTLKTGLRPFTAGNRIVMNASPGLLRKVLFF